MMKSESSFIKTSLRCHSEVDNHATAIAPRVQLSNIYYVKSRDAVVSTRQYDLWPYCLMPVNATLSTAKKELKNNRDSKCVR